MDGLRQCSVLILDDDAVSLARSRQLMEQFVVPERIFPVSNLPTLLRTLRTTPIDLAFVDIELPEADGFSVTEAIHNMQPNARCVFLTGHAELGAKSFEYEPLDFLCKPVELLRLRKTFERFDRTQTAAPHSSGQLAIEGVSGFLLLSPEEILCVTREGRRTTVACENVRHTVRASLEELEVILSEYGFFRCHQSFLVPLGKIRRVERAEFGNTFWAVLNNDVKVPVSRNRYAPLRERLAQEGTCFL